MFCPIDDVARIKFSYHLITQTGFQSMSVELRLQPGTFIHDALSTELPRWQLVLISWQDLEAQMELFSDSKNFFIQITFLGAIISSF